MAGTNDADRSAESRRILDEVARDTQRSGLFVLELIPDRARKHLGAADADQSDWTEVWGTRIGRTIGAVAIVALFAWLFRLLVSGA